MGGYYFESARNPSALARYPSLNIRFIRNISFKSLADFISRIATVSIMALLARRLDPSQFGLFSYALALSMAWVLFMDWGWNSVLIRKAKQQNFSSLLLSVFSLKLMVFFALMGLVVMIPALLPRRLPRS